MAWPPVERRQGIRVPAPGQPELIVPTSWPIHVQDMAAGGLSFVSAFHIPVGRRVRVSGTLAGRPFRAVAQVCWSGKARWRSARPTDIEVGAAFVAFADESERVLREFLNHTTA